MHFGKKFAATNGIVGTLKSEDKKTARSHQQIVKFNARDVKEETTLDNLFDGVRLSGVDLWIRIRRTVINGSTRELKKD